jgi:PAS domain S-box-containing protein
MSAEWQFLITLNEQLRPLRDPFTIQEVAVRLIGEHLQASRVNFARIEGDNFVISRSYADGVAPFPPHGPVGRFGTAIVEACRRGETVAVPDVRTDPRFTETERQSLLQGKIAAFVGVPLIEDGRWTATFAVQSARPRAWTRDQIALVQVTAERMWLAGERARAEEALGRSESRRSFLRRLNETIRGLADPERIIGEACRLLGTHLRANRVAYGVIDGDDCIISADYVDGLPSLAGRLQWRTMGDSRVADILTGETLTVSDTSIDVHSPEERRVLRAAGIGAYMCPLLVRDGRFVASFGIHSRVPREWTPDEIALAQEVADRIWATLEHRKAEAELREKEERLAFLLRLNDAIRPLLDPVAVEEVAARLLCEQVGATRVAYAEVAGHEYTVRCEYTTEPALAGRRWSGTIGGAIADLYERGETVVVNDLASDTRFSESERTSILGRGIAAFIGVGLIKGGRLVAAFGANYVTPRVWTPTEVALVRDVAERTWEAAERARAEAALREREQRLGLALSASGGGSWTWDVRTNDAYWDDAFRARFGFTPAEPPLFETWLAGVHPEDRGRMLAALEEVLHAKDTWDHTYRFVRSDGGVLWMQSLGRAVRDAAGQVTRLTGLELDVTERRRTEEVLQARREEERDRELRLLLQTATQGIVSVDLHGVIDSANRAFEAMFGSEPDTLIGQPIAQSIPLLFRGKHEQRGSRELVGHRQDGTTFPIEVTVTRVPTAGGERAFAFVTDITERRRAAEALQERTVELERLTTRLRRMAWDLTLAEHHAREQIARTLHDGLQQLLVIVDLNLTQQLTRERDTGAETSELLLEAKQHLNEAIAAARSLNLELFPPVLQRSGLPAALTWLATWTRDKYKVDVEVTADPRADSTRRDVRTLLFESVRELLFNAVKHARTDRVTVDLELGADDELSITVMDRGIGFEPAALDDFSQAGQVGWGLFSIRERLNLLGGRVEIDSAPGRGTRVRLVAPRGAAQDPGVAAIEPRPARPAPQPADGGERVSPDALRILIVDDHPAVRGALRKMLHERPQLSVVGDASNGLEAIARTHTLRPDVVLMDVAMPDMDGIEATVRIRAEFPDIQVFGLSMQTRSESIHAIERAGAAGFFVKALDTQRLIDELLALHASRIAAPRADR